MVKKNSSIWIEPWVQKELRHLSVTHGVPIGEVIEGFINLLRYSKDVENAEFQKWFKEILRDAMTNTGETGEWTS